MIRKEELPRKCPRAPRPKNERFPKEKQSNLKLFGRECQSRFFEGPQSRQTNRDRQTETGRQRQTDKDRQICNGGCKTHVLVQVSVLPRHNCSHISLDSRSQRPCACAGIDASKFDHSPITLITGCKNHVLVQVFTVSRRDRCHIALK